MKRRECINGITKVHSEVLLVNPKQIDSNWCVNEENNKIITKVWKQTKRDNNFS